MIALIIIILSMNLVILHARNVSKELNSSKIKNDLDKAVELIINKTGLTFLNILYKSGLDKVLQNYKFQPVKSNDWFVRPAELKMTSAELIVLRGFRSEVHSVVTDDGHGLGIFRIINPHISQKTKLKPVLIWHTLFTNSNLWLISSPGSLDSKGRYSELNGHLVNNCKDRLTSNLAFTLAACGYDVWLGNNRGSRYSPSYLNYSAPELNNYTFTELGIYDVKNTIEYIMKTTELDSLAYIGSSVGSTIMFTLLSLSPSIEKHLNPIITMPTITYLGNSTSTFRLFTPLVPILNHLVTGLGSSVDEATQRPGLFLNPILGQILSLLIQALFSNEPSYLSDTRTYILLASTASAGNYVSSRLYLQYGQFVLNGRFSQFDYIDPESNTRIYGQNTAPDYPLANITSRNLVFFRGPNDSLGRKADLDHLISSLTVAPKEVFVVNHPLYHHLDFALSKFNNALINWRIFHHLSDESSI